jgi:cytochrome c oxidase accessory protein FixG
LGFLNRAIFLSSPFGAALCWRWNLWKVVNAMKNTNKEKKSFRDKISTIDESGKRIWIFPKKPKGRLYRYRSFVSYFLLLIMFALPFIEINGKQAVLLNIFERKFIFFGVGFWPQDFHLFVIATISLIVFVVLFTVIYGRIWCGWACPQTIFLELVFRKIEYLIDGDALQQRKLKNAPWTPKKILKRTLKHSIFYGISFLIGNVLLAYFIGSERLAEIITAPPSENLSGFIAMVLFSLLFYWIYASFREQICTLVCPYGRLQGVLLDKKSIVVAYDHKRGEPRYKGKRERESGKGDCVDCNLCVDVCPTGIDIRNGVQLECVNCTACIDACNSVMRALKKPEKLIRYDSYEGIETGKKLRLNMRNVGYSIVLFILLSILATMFILRTPVETTILRTPGVLYQDAGDGRISNLYNIKIINKTFEKLPVKLNLKSPEGEIEVVSGEINIAEGSMAQTAFFIKIKKDRLNSVKTPVEIEVLSNGEWIETVNTAFIGPNKFNKK